MKETHTEENGLYRIRWVCQYPNCKGNGISLETKEQLKLREQSDISQHKT